MRNGLPRFVVFIIWLDVADFVASSGMLGGMGWRDEGDEGKGTERVCFG